MTSATAHAGRETNAQSAALTWLSALVERTVWLRAFRRDPLLAAVFGALSLSALAPVFASPILPLTDVGFNAMAGLLPAMIGGDEFLNQHFGVNWYPMPYWLGYGLQGVLSAVFGPLAAVRVFAALLVVLLPLSVMRLLLALGRDPRLAVLAFILTWDKNLYWGWFAFQLGMILCLWTLAKVVEAKDNAAAARLWPWAALVGLSHPHAILLLAAAGALIGLTRRPLGNGLLRTTIALSGTLITVVPWLLFGVLGRTKAASGTYNVDWTAIPEKIGGFFDYVLGNYVDATQAAIAGLGFLLLLLAPGWLWLLPQRPSRSKAAVAGALYFASLLLFLALPFAFWGVVSHWWTFPRYATYVLLGGLLLPRPNLSGLRSLFLVPGLILAIALHLCTFMQFSSFGKTARPLLRIIDTLPMHQTVLPLTLSWKHPSIHGHAVLGLHGYVAMAKRAYDPHLFDVPLSPVYYRTRLPHPNWSKQSTFDMDKHGVHYDYILVYPKSEDPLTAGADSNKVTLVEEAGPWRLYSLSGEVQGTK